MLRALLEAKWRRRKKRGRRCEEREKEIIDGTDAKRKIRCSWMRRMLQEYLENKPYAQEFTRVSRFER